MPEEKPSFRDVNVRQLCPWIAIFRAFGMAIDPKKLILAAAGILVMSSGWWMIASLFRQVSDDAAVQKQAGRYTAGLWDPEHWHRFAVKTDADGQFVGFGIVDRLLEDPLPTLWQVATNWQLVLRPVRDLVGEFPSMFSRDSGFVSIVLALLCGVWAVAVWAVFGGAITRIAAVQFARDERVGLKEAIQFAWSKFLSYLAAPLFPLGFIAFFAVFCAAGGLLSQIPGFGPVFAGSLWFLPLIAGFVMGLIAIAWAVGWPLMFSTISVEGSDSFDALSRSWAYAFQRPWHYLFYVLLAGTFGSVCAFFVELLVNLLVHMAQWAVSWGGGDNLGTVIDQLAAYAPHASVWRTPDPGELTGASWLGAICATFWYYFLFLLMVGFAYSFFWSASTIIYYLLRLEVDNTELEEVFVEGEEEDYNVPAGEPAAGEGAAAAAGGTPPPAGGAAPAGS